MEGRYWLYTGVLLTLLFWVVGAYNRLVRLRADVSRAFAALDAQLVRQMVWEQGCLPEGLRDGGDSVPAELTESPAGWRRVAAATEQFAVTLAQARTRPLDATALTTMVTAHEVLDTAWDQMLTAQAASGADDADVARLRGRRARLQHQAVPLAEAYDAAVLAYNVAVSTFPALLLGKLFGFLPAACIGVLTRAGARRS